jgi:hypothetical protein
VENPMLYQICHFSPTQPAFRSVIELFWKQPVFMFSGVYRV